MIVIQNPNAIPGSHASFTRGRRSVVRWCMLDIVMISSVDGCSRKADKWTQRRPPLFRGSGAVTFDGAAVEGAVVSFASLQQNLTAVGLTDAQGRFVLKTFTPDDGAVAGDHRVRITKIEATGYNKEGNAIGHVNRLPERYAGESGKLEATVEPKHGNVFRFELTSDKPSAQ